MSKEICAEMNEETEALFKLIRFHEDLFVNAEKTIEDLKKMKEDPDCKYFCVLECFVNFGFNQLEEKEEGINKVEILLELIPMITSGFDLKIFNPSVNNFKKKAEVIEFFSKRNPDDVELFLTKFPYMWIIQPEVLAFVKNPLVLYNKCKSKLFPILRGMFEESNRSVLLSVLRLAISLRLAADAHPNLEDELQDESAKIELIITTVFGFNTFDEPINVMSLVLPDFPKLGLASLKHNFAANIVNDDEFLGLCLKHNIKNPFACAAILERVTTLFWGFSDCESHHASVFYIFIAMNWSRSSPCQMLFLQCISKGVILFLAAYVSLQRYDYLETDSSSYGYSGTSASENSLIFITIFSLAYECGQIIDSYKFTKSFTESLADYSGDIWNRLDLSGYLLIILWAFFLINPANHYKGRIVLALSAIPLSLSLFQYMSVSKRLGSLIIMIFAMIGDLVSFLIVFLVAVMGFGIALWSLFHYDPTNEYSNSGQTMMTLFSAMMGGVDYTPFPMMDDLQSAWGLNGTGTINDWYSNDVRATGIAVYIVFVTIIGILLINLLIARMASTHDRIEADSKAEWAFLLASYTKSLLNVYEKCPLTMLPAPLNMLTLAVYPVDLWLKHQAGDKKTKIVSLSGTVADVLCRLILFPVRCTYFFVQAAQMALTRGLSEWRAKDKEILLRSKSISAKKIDAANSTKNISHERVWELFTWFLYFCLLFLMSSIGGVVLMFIDLYGTLFPKGEMVSYVKRDSQVPDELDESIRYVDWNIYQPYIASSIKKSDDAVGSVDAAEFAIRGSLMHPGKCVRRSSAIQMQNVTSPLGPGGGDDSAHSSKQTREMRDASLSPREKTDPMNREGRVMKQGTGEGIDNYYCGYTGKVVCGPRNGPQCIACQGFASTRNKKYMVIELNGLDIFASGEKYPADASGKKFGNTITGNLPVGTVVETDVKFKSIAQSGESTTRVRIVDGRGWLVLSKHLLQDVTNEVEAPLWTGGDLKVILSLLSSAEATSGSEDEDVDDRVEKSFDVTFEFNERVDALDRKLQEKDEALSRRVDALDAKLQEILGAIQSFKM